jgi:hypothetical protein
MRNLPQKVKTKIEVIKNIIATKSGLLSEHGSDNFKITLGDIGYLQAEDIVSDLVLEVTLKDVYCTECDFEPENISVMITEIKEKLYKASKFHISEKMELKNGNSLRGVLFYDCKIWRDEFETLTFGIFFDPGHNY